MKTEAIKSKLDQMNPEKREGEVATLIEEQTAKLPSDLFLWTALSTMAASLTLKILKKDGLISHTTALFVTGMTAEAMGRSEKATCQNLLIFQAT